MALGCFGTRYETGHDGPPPPRPSTFLHVGLRTLLALEGHRREGHRRDEADRAQSDSAQWGHQCRGGEPMARLDNLTPFEAVTLPSLSLDDRRLVLVIVAARFDMPVPGQHAVALTVASHQLPVPLADEYWGEPGASSLRREGQSTPLRMGTDVYFQGHAWAPGGKPQDHVLVNLRIGPCQQVAVVYGDRYWRSAPGGPVPSLPMPFEALALTYENGFGGTPAGASGEVACASERNPVGRGLFGGGREAIDQQLPNIENPRNLIRTVGDRPPPVGFGPVARHWQPRRSHAGTFDEGWERARAPLWPKDTDVRFFNAAAAALSSSTPLVGGETVHLAGVHPAGPIQFVLPRYVLQAKFELRRTRARRLMQLDALELNADAGSLTLFFRAALVVEPDPFAVERVVVRSLSSWERS